MFNPLTVELLEVELKVYTIWTQALGWIRVMTAISGSSLDGRANHLLHQWLLSYKIFLFPMTEMTNKLK